MPFWHSMSVDTHVDFSSLILAIDLANAADIAVALFSTDNETTVTLLCSTPISVNACRRRTQNVFVLGIGLPTRIETDDLG
jgi:hypothetical protein